MPPSYDDWASPSAHVTTSRKDSDLEEPNWHLGIKVKMNTLVTNHMGTRTTTNTKECKANVTNVNEYLLFTCVARGNRDGNIYRVIV